MSNAALPGLALLTSKPLATEAHHDKSGKTPTGPAFGTVLNKAVEAKPAQPAANTPKNPTTADAAPQEQAPIPADLKTGDQPPTVFDNLVLPATADALKPPTSLDVEQDDPLTKDPVADDLASLPNVTDLPAPQVDQVAALPVAIDPSTIPGLTRSAENAKAFTPADNVAGSAVMEAINLSRTMGQRGVSQVNIPMGTGRELKDVTAKAQAVDATEESTALPTGAALAPKVDFAERTAQTAAVVGATPSDEVSNTLTAPAPASAPTATTERATQDSKVQAAPTVDTNSFNPAPAPVLGSSNPSPVSPPPPTLQAPVASHEWNQGLGQQLVNMHLRGDQSVDLHLHPADLGPISINLRVTDSSQAQVQFFSHNSNVRSAIEQALPQLKEVMAQQGIALGQTSVGDQRQQQSSREDAPRAMSTRELGEKLNLVEAEPVKPSKIQTVSGQISTYA
jgi:flagellar hook-length control protein FliK